MPTIKVQKIPKKRFDPEDLLALFCYHFPQYTFSQARKLPYKRIRQMLKVVKKEHARQMIDLLQVVSAPHGGKRNSAKKVFDKFNAIINE